MRGAVIDWNETDPEGWSEDRSPAVKPSDIIVYELQHRDFSMHPTSGIQNKGKFLGLTETGTKTASGIPTGIENSMFQFGKLLVASLVSSLGTIAIAANSVTFTINNIGWTIVGSFGTVLLTVVGQCVGAGELEQAKAYFRKILAEQS